MTSFEAEMEMIKLDSIYSEFQKIEIALYNKSSVYPDKVLEKVDNLLIEHKTDLNITFDLRYLKAEIFYNIGEYNKSIEELELLDNSRDVVIAIICNYVQLNKLKEAKLLIDNNLKPFLAFDEFIFANYLEVINKKDEALAKYRKIYSDISNKRFFFYTLTNERISELEKKSPNLLKKIYFPTGNPSFKENIN